MEIHNVLGALTWIGGCYAEPEARTICLQVPCVWRMKCLQQLLMTNVRINDIYLRVYLLYMYPFSSRNMTFTHECIPMSHVLPLLIVIAHLYLSTTYAELLLFNLIFTFKKYSFKYGPHV